MNKMYLRQLRAYRSIAKWLDGHERLVNTVVITEVIIVFLIKLCS